MNNSRSKRTLLGALAIVGAMAFAIAGAAKAEPPLGQTMPTFTPAVYADGEVWGTKGTTPLPAPTDGNEQAFDKLYIISNGMAMTQLPVGEAAPGNPDYDGGRWDTELAVWTADFLMSVGGVAPTLMSADEVLDHVELGHLLLMGHPMGPGTPPSYFQCPLLPTH